MGKTIDIGGRIHNPEVGNVVTGANEILDDTKNKKQDVINSEVDAALEALDANKQDNLTFDQTPTESSTNPVTSGGVYAADLALQQAIEAILTLIPSAASALNQLADKSFVNSSIATASATFRGTYNLVSDLHLSVTASHQDIATALASVVSTADNNDYCFVQIPTSDTSSDIRVTERYKFNGTAWAYEYDLNNSGFTAQQWEAINSGITALLVTKLGALPTAAELATSLAGKQNVLTFDNVPVSGSDNPVKSGGLYQLFTAIDAKFPSDASSSNKLVAENRLAAYVTAIIEALDASFDVTSTDGHVTFRITQTNGQIASVQILTSDIASASALTTLTGRVSTNETDIANLQAAYAALTQSDVIIVNGALPSSGQQQNKIYRQPDPDHTPPQFYSDYMWNGSNWVLMATYNNAIDNVPMANSNNLVKSGGVFAQIGSLTEKGGNIIGNYSDGVTKGYYYNNYLQLVANSSLSCMRLICNHQPLKIKYTLLSTIGIAPILFAANVENSIKFDSASVQQGAHEYDLSSYDVIYLNFGTYLSNGYDIVPESEYYYNHADFVKFKGSPITYGADKLGLVTISNSKVVIASAGSNRYRLFAKSLFAENGIDKIMAIIPNANSYPAIVQTDDNDNVIEKLDTVVGSYLVKINSSTTKIYFNYFGGEFNNAFRLPDGIPLLQNKIDNLDNYQEIYKRTDVENEAGYVGRDGGISITGGHKHRKISGKYIKSVAFTITSPLQIPVIITEKNGVFDNVPPYNDGKTIFNIDYECDYIYINFYNGDFLQNDEVIVYKDIQHNYKTDIVLADVLNRPYLFNGKTAWFFGDSITKGYTRESGELIITENGFPKQFSDSVGLTFQNFGSGGESIYRDGDNNYTLYHVQQAGELTSDYIFVASGSNDYAVQNSITNFKSAVISLFDYLSANYSGEVIIILPINRVDRDLYHVIQMDEYRDVLMKEAIKHKFSVVNGASFAFPMIKNDINAYLLADDGHPTEDGYGYYAKMLRTRLC